MNITLNSTIYPLEAILNTCYTFIEKAYIFLDKGKRNNITVSIEGKKKLNPKQFEALRGEFMNELLHSSLRYQISKNNKKIREYIIGRALYSALPQPVATVKVEDKEDNKLDFKDDPLGIAIPWEEKYGKKNRTIKIVTKDAGCNCKK